MAKIPTATYRLQLNRNFTFRDALNLAGYLDRLGISTLYLSPLLAARPGSSHGYDVVDHSRVNPELGSLADLRELGRELSMSGLGMLLDLVPNHMGIAESANPWWNDVLENGPSSPFASHFDIEWSPFKAALANKVLVPLLGDQYGRVLENQEIRLGQEEGAFHVQYHATRLPLSPESWPQILRWVRRRLASTLDDEDPHLTELESILTALSHLPSRAETDPEKVRERKRETGVVKARLQTLLESSEPVRTTLQDVLDRFNGRPGDPASFDALETLLADQAFRLCHWKVALDEINYRRFFDVNDLAAIRVEVPAVFEAVHSLVLDLMSQGLLQGLRIDHPDGLLDPEGYFQDLQEASRTALEKFEAERNLEPAPPLHGVEDDTLPCYVVVEKILERDEALSSRWMVHGTTGYDFLNLVNGLFVMGRHVDAMTRIYRRFSGITYHFEDLVYWCKKLILQVSMSSELQMLATRLDRLSEQHRYSRDFTMESLRAALAEVIACFPVYRSYIRPGTQEVTGTDWNHIVAALHDAKRRNPATSESLFDFLGSVLLLEDPEGLSPEDIRERREFVLRFQQLTGPVMAKGLEDTAFYRSNRLMSLNEVGGDPQRFGTTPEEFHRKNLERQTHWPHGLSCTSTHDTKRSEDVRARINVLSEIPAEWERALLRWREYNQPLKSHLGGQEVPDPNEEYLLYQALVGAWPLTPPEDDHYPELVARFQAYMQKAIKEAKVHTSWVNPNESHDQAVHSFVEHILRPSPSNRFLADFTAFTQGVARAGLYNSLSQVVLKVASPGVPDIYQGNEVWDFSLVDPDNRRPVAFDTLDSMLTELESRRPSEYGSLMRELARSPEDGRLKMHVTRQALRLRRERASVFAFGSYLPLESRGRREEHVCAFARQRKGDSIVVATARFFIRLGARRHPPMGRQTWKDSYLILPRELPHTRFRDVFTGKVIASQQGPGWNIMPLHSLFSLLPVALLHPEPRPQP